MMLSPSRFATLAAAALSLSACAVEPTTGADSDAAEAADAAAVAPALSGKYAFVWGGARKAEVYGELEQKLSGRALEDAKREVDKEAADSWIEFGTDGVFHSWIGEEEIATAKYELEKQDDHIVMVRMNGKSVRVQLDGDDIVIADPTKGELTFRRVR